MESPLVFQGITHKYLLNLSFESLSFSLCIFLLALLHVLYLNWLILQHDTFYYKTMVDCPLVYFCCLHKMSRSLQSVSHLSIA
jgi:hypothetical protein